MSDNRLRIGITTGDPNGIGPEVIVKALADPRMVELCTPVLYGPAGAFARYKKSLGDRTAEFAPVVVTGAREARRGNVSLVDTRSGELEIVPGTASAAAGKAAAEALRAAIADLKEGQLDALVTGPIDKASIHSEDFPYTGHTELLADAFEARPLMILCGERLRVALATIHVPLSEVSGLLTVERIVTCVRDLARSLTQDFGIVKPRIAVLALNPHAGDGGLLGEEELTVIRPAVEQVYGEGVLVFGPFAADGFFASAGWTRYDGVLAMYHDGGLAPFKALVPGGVNFTAGLSVVRTSPAHGVAYDIAGQGVADESSMREAIYAALDICRARAAWNLMSRDPLRHYEHERSGKDVSVKDLLPAGEEN